MFLHTASATTQSMKRCWIVRLDIIHLFTITLCVFCWLSFVNVLPLIMDHMKKLTLDVVLVIHNFFVGLALPRFFLQIVVYWFDTLSSTKVSCPLFWFSKSVGEAIVLGHLPLLVPILTVVFSFVTANVPCHSELWIIVLLWPLYLLLLRKLWGVNPLTASLNNICLLKSMWTTHCPPYMRCVSQPAASGFRSFSKLRIHVFVRFQQCTSVLRNNFFPQTYFFWS